MREAYVAGSSLGRSLPSLEDLAAANSPGDPARRDESCGILRSYCRTGTEEDF